jgi:Fur family zinc uptake transcriptional regulator
MNETPITPHGHINEAALYAKANGQRWTEMRRAVYAHLLAQTQPITAYQILADLAKKLQKDIKPASIYRSLDALCGLGLLIKIETINAYLACRHHDHQPHQHVFLICDQCGHIDEITDITIGRQLLKTAAQKGFKASRQVIELRGDCLACTHKV